MWIARVVEKTFIDKSSIRQVMVGMRDSSIRNEPQIKRNNVRRLYHELMAPKKASQEVNGGVLLGPNTEKYS